uniref:triacylglycerol lipase n=1 Tax=Yarrowia yakushimensis TaxID=1527289 RepID=A0A078BRW4_9ASCO|nr:lipase [Yarrowia yakushimensis]
MKIQNILLTAWATLAAALPTAISPSEAAVLQKRVFTSTVTTPIDQDDYNFFQKYARLANIGYCVGPLTQIFPPFTCGLQCAYFPNVELIQEFDDPLLLFDVSGYLAVDHNSQQIYLVIRGTHSLEDVITDLRVTQAPLTNFDLAANISATATCEDCLVHSGFMQSYNDTFNLIGPKLDSVIAQYPNYQIAVTGHSLGGAAALLFGINLKVNGHDPLVVTLGQPIVGNAGFANWVDTLFFGQENPDVSKVTPDRKLYRITHQGDIVPQIPFWAGYQHCSGEVFIDWPLILPPLSTVVMCEGQSNSQCSAGNTLLQQANVLGNHLQYFVTQGICGI